MMNHHTIPKMGFGPYKNTKMGRFYLPKILSSTRIYNPQVALTIGQGSNKAVIPLPAEKFESNKR